MTATRPVLSTPFLEANRRDQVPSASRFAGPETLSVICLLDDLLSERVSSALPGVRAAAHASDLFDAAVRGDLDMIIADPTLTERCAEEMIRVRREFPSVLVVVFTRFQPESVRHLVRLAGHGIDEVILFRFDDTPMRFAELVDRRRSTPLVKLVLENLDGNLARLPVPIRLAIVSMFDSPRDFRSTGDLADAAGVPLRTLYRNLHSADIGSARRLVVAARAMRAITMLQDPGRSVRDVSRLLRYSKSEHLTAHLDDLTAARVSEIRQWSDLRDLARIVAARICVAECRP